jgi:DNA-directed RNA polymerase specialized sigma subunit
MIKTEAEYAEAKKRLEKEFQEIESHQLKMKKAGLNVQQIKLAIDPLATFAFQLQEEVEEYEKLKRGQFEPLENLNGIGHMLVALRIYKGVKQKELAEKLGIKESQVSRDERNEYHGASIEKIQKVLDALGAKLKSEVENPLKRVI